MATGKEVLEFLRPAGGWTIYGDNFDSIIYEERCQLLTKKEFDDGFKAYDAYKAKQNADKAAARQAILARLGITAEEATILLG